MNAPEESICSTAAGKPRREDLAGDPDLRPPPPSPAQRDRLPPKDHHREHEGGAERAADGGADRGACDAEGGEPEVAQNQRVGHRDVDDVGKNRRCQRRPAVTGAAEHRPADEREEQRHRGGGDDLEVGDRRRRYVGFGAEETDDRRRRVVHPDRDRNRQDQPPDDRLPRQVVGPLAVAGANRLGNEHGRPDIDRREDRDDEEDNLKPRADAGHRRRAKPRHHQGVHRADRGLQQVLADDRRRQRQHPALGHRLRRRLRRLLPGHIEFRQGVGRGRRHRHGLGRLYRLVDRRRWCHTPSRVLVPSRKE
jgi:hypothetical protein